MNAWRVLLVLVCLVFCSCRWGFEERFGPDAGEDAGLVKDGGDIEADRGEPDAGTDGGEWDDGTDGGEWDDGADDGGQVTSFEPVALVPGGQVWRVGLTRVVPDNMYALVARYRVFRSTDGALSWSACTDLPIDEALDLAAVPNAPEAVLVATNDDVYLSDDGCQSWQPTGLGMHSWKVLPLAVDDYFAATRNGLWRYSPGNGWQEVFTGLGSANFQDVIATPDGQNMLAATQASGVVRSPNGGLGWSPANIGLPTLNVRGLSMDVTNTHAYAAERNNLCVSHDGGGTWTAQVSLSELEAVTLNPALADYVFINLWVGLHFSDDFGASSSLIVSHSLYAGARAQPPVFHPGGSVAFLPTGRGLFAVSQPDLVFEERNQGIEAWDVNDILTDGSGRLHLATTAGVMYTNDDGQSWNFQHQGLISDSAIGGLVIDQQDPDKLCVRSCVSNAVACSGSGGSFNQLLYAGSNYGWCIHDLAVSGQRMYGASGLGLTVSTNAGTDWIQVMVEGPDRVGSSLLVDWAGGPHVVLATDSGIFHTTDDGQSFTSNNQGLTSLEVNVLGRMATGEYLAGATDGLYLSGETGLPWSSLACQGMNVADLLVYDDAIVAICDSSVYFSSDRGASFDEIPGVAGLRLVSLGRGLSGDLLVGTHGYGLFRVPFPG